MTGYRYEQGDWTDGFGARHIVVRFYVPDDDDDWMTCAMEPGGSLRRMWSRGPVHLRSGPGYASAAAAMAAVKAAHEDWLLGDRDGWKQAIGVLNPKRGNV